MLKFSLTCVFSSVNYGITLVTGYFVKISCNSSRRNDFMPFPKGLLLYELRLWLNSNFFTDFFSYWPQLSYLTPFQPLLTFVKTCWIYIAVNKERKTCQIITVVVIVNYSMKKKLENNTTITRSNEVWNVKHNLCQNFVNDQLPLLYVFLLGLIYLFCLL